MKNKTIGIFALVLLAVGCGKENKISTTPFESTNTDGFTTGVLATGGTPKTKDSVSFNSMRKYQRSGNLSCVYIVDTNIVVLRADANNIRMKINSDSRGQTRNSTYCPYAHPSTRSVQYVNLSMTQFIEQTKKTLNSALNPSVFCGENSDWCANVRLIERKDVTQYGIPSVYVEAEYRAKNGDFYNRKTYISKNSLLQNAYEFEMTNVRTGERVDFKTLRPSRRPRDSRR